LKKRVRRLALSDGGRGGTFIGLGSVREVLFTYDGKKKGRKGLLQYNGAGWLHEMRIEQPPDPAKGTLFKTDS